MRRSFLIMTISAFIGDHHIYASSLQDWLHNLAFPIPNECFLYLGTHFCIRNIICLHASLGELSSKYIHPNSIELVFSKFQIDCDGGWTYGALNGDVTAYIKNTNIYTSQILNKENHFPAKVESASCNVPRISIHLHFTGSISGSFLQIISSLLDAYLTPEISKQLCDVLGKQPADGETYFLQNILNPILNYIISSKASKEITLNDSGYLNWNTNRLVTFMRENMRQLWTNPKTIESILSYLTESSGILEINLKNMTIEIPLDYQDNTMMLSPYLPSYLSSSVSPYNNLLKNLHHLNKDKERMKANDYGNVTLIFQSVVINFQNLFYDQSNIDKFDFESMLIDIFQPVSTSNISLYSTIPIHQLEVDIHMILQLSPKPSSLHAHFLEEKFVVSLKIENATLEVLSVVAVIQEQLMNLHLDQLLDGIFTAGVGKEKRDIQEDDIVNVIHTVTACLLSTIETINITSLTLTNATVTALAVFSDFFHSSGTSTSTTQDSHNTDNSLEDDVDKLIDNIFILFISQYKSLLSDALNGLVQGILRSTINDQLHLYFPMKTTTVVNSILDIKDTSSHTSSHTITSTIPVLSNNQNSKIYNINNSISMESIATRAVNSRNNWMKTCPAHQPISDIFSSILPPDYLNWTEIKSSPIIRQIFHLLKDYNINISKIIPELLNHLIDYQTNTKTGNIEIYYHDWGFLFSGLNTINKFDILIPNSKFNSYSNQQWHPLNRWDKDMNDNYKNELFSSDIWYSLGIDLIIGSRTDQSSSYDINNTIDERDTSKLSLSIQNNRNIQSHHHNHGHGHGHVNQSFRIPSFSDSLPEIRQSEKVLKNSEFSSDNQSSVQINTILEHLFMTSVWVLKVDSNRLRNLRLRQLTSIACILSSVSEVRLLKISPTLQGIQVLVNGVQEGYHGETLWRSALNFASSSSIAINAINNQLAISLQAITASCQSAVNRTTSQNSPLENLFFTGTNLYTGMKRSFWTGIFLILFSLLSIGIGCFVYLKFSSGHWSNLNCSSKCHQILPNTSDTTTSTTNNNNNIKSTAQSEKATVLLYRDEVPVSVKFLLPFLILCNIALFLRSTFFVAGSVSVRAEVAGQSYTPNQTIFEFSVRETITQMWDAGVYPLAVLIGLFSGIWPYFKLLVLLTVLFVPSECICPSTRTSILQWLNYLGKYSLLDVFVMVLTMTAFHLQFLLPDNHGQVIIYVKPEIGFYCFLFGTILNMILGHIFLWYHSIAFPSHVSITILTPSTINSNTSGTSSCCDGTTGTQRIKKSEKQEVIVSPKTCVSLSNSNYQQHPDVLVVMNLVEAQEPLLADYEDRSCEARTSFTSTSTRGNPSCCCYYWNIKINSPPAVYFSLLINVLVGLILWSLLILVLFGMFVKGFQFEFRGLVTWVISPTDRLTTYSVFSIGHNLPDTAKLPYLSIGGIVIIATLYLLFVVVIPVLNIFALICFWFIPMSWVYQRKLLYLTNWLQSWCCLEVFVLAIITALLQVQRLAAYIIGETCQDVNALLRDIPPALLYGEPKCFARVASVTQLYWVTFVAAISLAVISPIVCKLGETNLQERALEPVEQTSNSPLQHTRVSETATVLVDNLEYSELPKDEDILGEEFN